MPDVNDKQKLLALISAMRDVLLSVVDAPAIIPKEYRTVLLTERDSLVDHFEDLTIAVMALPSGSDQSQWAGLHRCGLTGASLKLKMDLFLLDWTGKRWKKLLDRINSLLGSLNAAMGGIADYLKEYKEQVEASIPDDSQDSEWPITIKPPEGW